MRPTVQGLKRLFGPATQEDLREAVDGLPLIARIAMLDGLRCERIIAGAYVDHQGGVCPVTATVRRDVQFALPRFARTWDSYTRVKKKDGPTTVSVQHTRALVAMLEESIRDDPDRLGPLPTPGAPAGAGRVLAPA